MNRWQCADYADFQCYIKIVVAMVTEIAKMLRRLGTYVLRATPMLYATQNNFSVMLGCFSRLNQY